jgi:hypothetical protein
MKEKIFDYRGDCWKGYQDVGLCLRILPPGKSFSFIIEKDKAERMKQVIYHNKGQINSEEIIGDSITMHVQKKFPSNPWADVNGQNLALRQRCRPSTGIKAWKTACTAKEQEGY